MFWMIIGIIVTVVLFVLLGISKNGETNRYGDPEYGFKLRVRQLWSLFGLVICLFGCATRVPANAVGILYSPFHGTSEETLSEGFHTKNIFDKVYKISTEVQSMTVENLTTQTKDAQYLNSQLDIKYKVNASNAYVVFKQYRTLKNMSENLIISTAQRMLELVTIKYNVIDVLGEKRSNVYSELEISLAEELSKYGVEFISVTILDMDAGEKLENAITDEAVAKKAVETAAQNLLKAETEAKQKSVQAQAEQDAAKIEAETKIIQAEAEKQANDLLNRSLTDSVLRKEWINKWDGKMPTYYGGDDTSLMFDVSGVAE